MVMPKSPPSHATLMHQLLGKSPERWRLVFASAPRAIVDGRYVHWNKLTYLTPPGGMTTEEWWTGIKWARQAITKHVHVEGEYTFAFSNPDPLQQMLCDFDRNTSGRVQISDQIVNPHTRDRYVVSAIIEESISSSQLEGASTERKVASDMIRSGRKPRDKSEQMIMNNYVAMQYIRRIAKTPLTVDTIRVIHRMVAEDTLPEEDLGRYRRDDDNIRVEDPATMEVLHVPPPAANIERRLAALCDFANGVSPAGVFIHPAVRAIILHFWLAFEHPFIDGNGRTARALFYWSMLNSGYWLCEYISISRIVHQAAAQYRDAFLYTETDENDVTYFILYHLEVVMKAIDALHAYLRKKLEDTSKTQGLMKKSMLFNHRQLALLTHAMRHPGAHYSIKTHQTSHQVVYQTARTDLMELQQKGLLSAFKIGKGYVFISPPDIEERLRTVTLPSEL